jgi:hypothetical protein
VPNRMSRLAVGAIGFVLLLGGSAEAAYIYPSSQDYGNQNVGTSSAPVGIQLGTSPTVCTYEDPFAGCLSYATYNVDTTELGGGPGTTTTTGDFVTHNVSCPYPTMTSPFASQASSSCQFEASFLPTAVGPRSRTLSFPENGGPGVSVSLFGNGVDPATAAAAASSAAPTGQRNAATKRCKKKFPKGSLKRTKCLKRARLLPL